MNYAFMSFSTPDLSLDETLSLAKDLGYNGFEPRSGSGHAHGIELEASTNERNTIRAKAEENGVALCCLAISCRYADPSTVTAQVDETLRYIDLAGDIGAPCLRVFGGQIPDGISREQGIEGVATTLRQVAAQASARDVFVCMETHDDWCNPDHVAAVMKQVDHPNIAVNWDIWHPIRKHGWTIKDSFQAVRPWIRHAHIHDGTSNATTLELRPIGTGEVDHGTVIQLLQADGYEGYLSGEWIKWEPYDVHLPRELAALKAIEESVV
ncbi:sugar phosphate isomerase/epimerase [Chloroflexi bacterium TSY]|nr:sugar phosphate isomerase/epimerase [Chloroflexi bacterium TSY]